MEQRAFSILTDAERQLLDDTPENQTNDFLPRFIKWAGMKTDAPEYTLRAAGLMALSLAAGDTVVLPPLVGSSPIFMNLYILMVGPSTIMRKTTVLGYIADLLPVNQQSGERYITFLDDVSPQAFFKVTGKNGLKMAPVIMAVDEVSGLMAQAKKRDSHMAGFEALLLKAYDHTPINIARTKGNIENPYGCFVNLFAASTPEPLMEVLGDDDINSGLLPRFIIFDGRDAGSSKRIPFGSRIEDDEEWTETAEGLKAFLLSIAAGRAAGVPLETLQDNRRLFPVTEIQITPEALARIDQIDEMLTESARRDESGWAAIKGRALWHVVKVSGLHALSRNPNPEKVTVLLIDVLRAARLVEDTTNDLHRMREEMGTNNHERLILAAVKILDESRTGKVKQAQFSRKLGLSHFDLMKIAGTMVTREIMKTEKDPRGDIQWIRRGVT